MNKRLLVIGLGLALGGVSTASLAGGPGDFYPDTSGNFYLGASASSAHWNIDTPTPGVHLDDSSTAVRVTLGYVWHWGVDFAVEGGYADLGELTSDWADSTGSVHTTLKNQGLFGGVKVGYRFARNWHISGRTGLYENRMRQDGVEVYTANNTVVTDRFSYDQTKTRWYAGVGLGVDVTPQFALSLNYDYYAARFEGVDIDIDATTLGAQFRF